MSKMLNTYKALLLLHTAGNTARQR